MRVVNYLFAALMAAHLQAAPLVLFDTHLHYNQDARASFSANEVISKLNDAGIERALVSSTDDSGTQLLLETAPTRFIAGLRPYRGSGEIKTWMYDETVIDHLQTKLRQHSYRVFGEFHAFEQHIELPVVQQALALAQEYNLILHLHGDAGAVDQLFKQWPEAQLIWAHAGFEEPETISELLRKHPNLWVDLSHRSDISTWAGLASNWRAAFIEHPKRFLIGSDTYSLERWQKFGYFALDTRDWLSTLPSDLAEQIAYKNAEQLFDR